MSHWCKSQQKKEGIGLRGKSGVLHEGSFRKALRRRSLSYGVREKRRLARAEGKKIDSFQCKRGRKENGVHASGGRGGKKGGGLLRRARYGDKERVDKKQYVFLKGTAEE